ncbi:MAG: hypothetical protein IJ675_09245, partial [Pseudobutyrivibrio sp.]|nr:hypothetical protein [Pseudobutyrivibrio sp.]
MAVFESDFYKNLVESLDNNSVLRIKNDDGVYLPIQCSREFAEMMECTPEQFIMAEQEEPLSTIYESDRASAKYLLENKHSEDGKNHITIRKRTMRGNIIWVDLHFAFFDYEGKQYAYCNYFDVTSLKENEFQMQAAFQTVKDDLNVMSADSLVTMRANLMTDAIEDITGKELYEFDNINSTFSTIIRSRLEYFPLEADKKCFQTTFNPLNLIAKYNMGQTTVDKVLYSRRQSGRQCFVKYSVIMRLDPNNGNIMVFATEQEYNSEKITETMNEKILAKQYDMITYITDGKYGVVIGDAKNIKYGSIFPKELTGVYEDYIKNQVIPVIKEEDKQRLAEALSLDTIGENLRKSEPYSVDVECFIDGDTYYKRFDFYGIDIESNFYILLKSDYTEIQKENMNRNEQLRVALKEAEQASVAKTSFLSRMSHEIRTPMNAIIGLDTIALQEENLSEDLRDNLTKIGSSARYLLSLINDILDMSRIESGRMVVKNEDFAIEGFLEDVNTIIYSQCQDKGLNYDCFIHGDISDRYIGDDQKLKQILINILGNSVKFTPEGGNVSLDVNCKSKADGIDILQFIIKDTGIGMDAEFIPKLFEAFPR